EAGRIEQDGRPKDVYRRPATAFVARFLGRANFLDGVVTASDGAGIVVALGEGMSVVAGPARGATQGQPGRVAIRQENGQPLPEGGSAGLANSFPVTVVFHAFAGQAQHYVVQLADGRELQVATSASTRPLARGARALVEWRPADVIVLPDASRGEGAS